MTIAIPVPCEILGFGGFVRPKLGIGALETERFAPNECAVGMLVNLRGGRGFMISGGQPCPGFVGRLHPI